MRKNKYQENINQQKKNIETFLVSGEHELILILQGENSWYQENMGGEREVSGEHKSAKKIKNFTGIGRT